jgi:lysophospholipase L1-like esterase
MKGLWRKKWIVVVAILLGVVSSSWVLSMHYFQPEIEVVEDAIAVEEEMGEFSFIQYKLNRLEIRGKYDNWDKLFSKMEEVAFNGVGKVSVIHIGGSHVQGGALTDRMRANFTEMLYGAQGERGFVFPFEIAGVNCPYSIKSSWTGTWTGARTSVNSEQMLWGVSGVSATTKDSSATINIKALDYEKKPFKFNRVRIYNQRSENMKIVLDPDIRITRQKEYLNLGYMEYEFTPAKSDLVFSIQRTDSTESFFTFQGVYLGNDDSGLTYNAIGVNGASAMSYMRGELFQPQLNTLAPDLAIFGIGINDANVPNGTFNAQLYYDRFVKMIKAFRTANPDVCFIFIVNNDTYFQKRVPNRNVYEIQRVLYRLAENYDGAVYDMFEIMGGLGSIRDWQNAKLAMDDKLHLSRKGYELQADMMSEALKEAFGNYLSSKNIQ